MQTDPSTVGVVLEFLKALAQLLWPTSVLVGMILFRADIHSLASRLRRGKLLGQELELAAEAQRLEIHVEAAEKKGPPKLLVASGSDKVEQLAQLKDAGERVFRFLEEASQDKLMAIVRLGIEIEYELRNLIAVRGFLEYLSRHNLREYLDLLLIHKVISVDTATSVVAFAELRNAIVHRRSERVPSEESLVAVIDSGLRLLEVLRSVPRETYKVLGVVPFYFDPGLTTEVPGARAVILDIEAADGNRRVSAFPTTRSYKRGEVLSWEWDFGRVWGPSWYKDPDSGEVTKGWDSSAEFTGRPLDEIS